MISETLAGQIKSLAKYENEVLSVTYVWNGESLTERGRLESDNHRVRCIDILKEKDYRIHIPLLGNGCAVQEITDENGNVLYKNHLIDESYPENIENIRKECGFD